MDWAIVIGIDEYRSAEEPSLRSAVADAVAFREWVVPQLGEDEPEKRVYTLLGRRDDDRGRIEGERPASKDNVLGAINELMTESAGFGERLFFFFSGHGVTATWANREEGALVFPRVDDVHPAQTLAVRSIAEFFETTRFEDQFFFIDACRTPLGPHEAEIGGWSIPRRRAPGQPPVQQFILYATAPGLPAQSSLWSEQLSAFSRVLMPGLEGRGNAKAWSWERKCYEVRWERLASYVHRVMQSDVEDDPSEVPFQIPQDVGIRGVAGRDRDALLARPANPPAVAYTLKLPDNIDRAVVKVRDAVGVTLRTFRDATGSQTFELPPRTYSAMIETPRGEIGYVVPPLELYDEPPTQGPDDEPPPVEIRWLDDDGPASVDPYLPGTITIESPDPLAVADVRDETGHGIGVATQQDGCTAPPGFYRVRLVGPERDKTSKEDVVPLRSGKTELAELSEPDLDERAAALAEAFGGSSAVGYVKPTADASPAAWAQPSTVVTAGFGAALGGDRTALEALGLEEVPVVAVEGGGVVFVAVRGTGAARPFRSLRVRVWPVGGATPKEEEVRTLEATTADVASVVEVAGEAKPHWLSIEPDDADVKPTIVALPLLKSRIALLVGQVDSDQVRLYQFHPHPQQESGRPERLRRLELLQRQLLGGRLEGAEDIALGGPPNRRGIVQQLTADAEKDPFGSCLVGYVLLRLGYREWLGDVASAIIEAAPTLSDAYILRGEYHAYKGNQEASSQAFADAIGVGIPAFGEGLTRLVEGLRVSGLFHPRGALVRYIFQRHVRGNMWSAFTPKSEFKEGRLVITGADLGYEG